MKTIHDNITEKSKLVNTAYRDRIEVLRGRVELLSGIDRVLMKMYLENGNSFREMSKLAGVNEATIGRRIHKITDRLLDGRYIICLRNASEFSKMELFIARDYFLLGLSMRKICAKEDFSYYRVRQEIRRIQAVCSRLKSIEKRRKE